MLLPVHYKLIATSITVIYDSSTKIYILTSYFASKLLLDVAKRHSFTVLFAAKPFASAVTKGLLNKQDQLLCIFIVVYFYLLMLFCFVSR